MKKAKLNLLIGLNFIFSFLAPVGFPTCLLSAQDKKPEPYLFNVRDGLVNNETYAVFFSVKGGEDEKISLKVQDQEGRKWVYVNTWIDIS